MPHPTTMPECLAHLTTVPAESERGLRFCFGREREDHAGVFLPWPVVARRIAGVAERLRAAGVNRGMVVAVHAHDQQVALLALLGAMQIGAIPTALAPVGGGNAARLIDQFHAVLAVAQPHVLIVDRALPDEVITGHPALPTLVTLDDYREADPPPAIIVDPESPCFLQFTSGSTSIPKGVVVTHRMLLANVDSLSAVLGWDAHGRCVGWLPIYHDMSLVGMYAMVVCKAARGCFFPTSRFGRSPDLWLRLLAEEKAHFSAGPNFAFAMVARYAARRPLTGLDLSHMRGFVCGSEPISPAIMQAFAAVTAPLGLQHAAIPAFGMAESTLMASSCRPGQPLQVTIVERQALEQDGLVRVVQADRDDPQVLALVGCGPAGPGMHVAIDRAGTLVGEGLVGEVLLAGPSILTRYWRNDTATAAAFVDHAGTRWFRTGDLGFLHAGHLHICGRAKDVIIHNGVNYYPADVEAALARALPRLVKIAAVVDVRPDLSAEFIGLGVLFEGGAGLENVAETEATVAAFVKDYTGLPVARALALAGGTHIPRTTSGKLMRPAIRDLLRGHIAR